MKRCRIQRVISYLLRGPYNTFRTESLKRFLISIKNRCIFTSNCFIYPLFAFATFFLNSSFANELKWMLSVCALFVVEDALDATEMSTSLQEMNDDYEYQLLKGVTISDHLSASQMSLLFLQVMSKHKKYPMYCLFACERWTVISSIFWRLSLGLPNVFMI